MRAMHKAGQAPARLSHSGKRGKGDAPFPIRSALRTASNLIWLRNYRSRPASIQFPRNWPISQFRAVHFPSPLGRGCAETLSRGPGFRGCDREGAHKHADQCGAASRSGVASKHNTLGTCSALRGRRGEGSGDLLDRREEIFEDRARAEVDLGVDLHAGDETKLPALALGDRRTLTPLISV